MCLYTPAIQQGLNYDIIKIMSIYPLSTDPVFHRFLLLAGIPAMQKLADTRVLVFGVGGVGSWCAEALVRSGIGNISMIDFDTVCVTNINRQIQALPSTVGESKVCVLKKRLEEINPKCAITVFDSIFSKETAETFDIENADYIIDAIDTVSNKLDLIEYACEKRKIIYSSMGMAQKLDPSRIKIADIWKTEGCPLARLVRSGLRQRGFKGHFKTVYSNERLPVHKDLRELYNEEPRAFRKTVNGTSVTVTATAGMTLASLILQDIYYKYKDLHKDIHQDQHKEELL